MIYLDNAGTTKMDGEVAEKLVTFFDDAYGNASSLHTFGQIAKEKLENARAEIAQCLNADPSEIYFTSGGSESDNWAIFSASKYARIKGKNHIITTNIEHHAVLNPMKELEKQGFRVTYLPAKEDGIVDIQDLKNAITPDTFLVSVMMANNEIGTIQPVKEIGGICREKNIIFHTDAVQAVGHIEVDTKKMNIDMLSLSAHKFHGPKGVGALFCRKGVPLFNHIYGGAQENSRRAGTENVPGIMAMSLALKKACKDMKAVAEHEIALRNLLFNELSKIPHSIINGSTKNRLPNNFNMCFEGIEGESLLLLLDDAGICASSGSACTSGSLDPSHVLLAIGRPHEIAHGSLRLTLSKYTTKQEIEKVLEVLPAIVQKLRDMSPVWNSLKKGEKSYVI